ncbi:MAG: hypothetical protein MZV65_48285 [Chromatiales bacterium]|nr:hypothetical protein [Chromatiales bacterium]
MLQRLARVLLGAIEVAGIAVGDGEITLADRDQIVVALLLPDVQRAARCADAQAEFAAFGQRHGLAAVLIAVELDAIAPVEELAFSAQRLERFRVVLPRFGHAEGCGRAGRLPHPGPEREAANAAASTIEQGETMESRRIKLTSGPVGLQGLFVFGSRFCRNSIGIACSMQLSAQAGRTPAAHQPKMCAMVACTAMAAACGSGAWRIGRPMTM